MAVDLGAGDGRFVLATAAARPSTLVIGVDADASRMVEASRRAARPHQKGGLPNAIFVVSGAQDLPAELGAIADEMTVHFPWGSLLRGVATPEPWFVALAARILKPDGALTVLLSVTDRDRSVGIDPIGLADVERLERSYAAAGLELVAAGVATEQAIAGAHSGWAKRLNAGRDRPAWRYSLRRTLGSAR